MLQTEVVSSMVPNSDKSPDTCAGRREPSCSWVSPFLRVVIIVYRSNRLDTTDIPKISLLRNVSVWQNNSLCHLSPQMRKCNVGGCEGLRRIQCKKYISKISCLNWQILTVHQSTLVGFNPIILNLWFNEWKLGHCRNNLVPVHKPSLKTPIYLWQESTW